MRWSMLALLFAARVGLGFQFQTLSSVGDELVAVFGLSYADIGTLVGLFMLPGIFLALPAGFFGHFLSDRILSAAGMLVLSLGGVVCALADSSWLIGLGRVLCGVGFLVASLYFTKMTADWFSGREIATAMSVLVMSWPFGIALGQIGHEWLAQVHGWRWPFIIAAAYGAMASVALFAFYRSPEAKPATGAAPPQVPGRRELHLTLIAALGWAAFNAGYIIYLTFAPLLLKRQGIGGIEAAAIISIASWLMILSGAVCGQIADRTRRFDLILVLCLLGAMGALALLEVRGAGIAASLIFGLIGMAPAGLIMALTGEALRPQQRAIGMGFFMTVYFLINAATPPLAGWIYDTAGDPFGPILCGIVLFGSVIALNARFRAVQRRASPRQPG